MTQRVRIDGMSCRHCAMSVREALNGIEGVSSVEVNLDDGMATVETTSEISKDAYSEAISRAGYTLSAVE